MNVLSSLVLLSQDVTNVAATTEKPTHVQMEQGEVITKSFELMGKGLIGIFVTIIIIMICVFILTYLAKRKTTEKTEK